MAGMLLPQWPQNLSPVATAAWQLAQARVAATVGVVDPL